MKKIFLVIIAVFTLSCHVFAGTDAAWEEFQVVDEFGDKTDRIMLGGTVQGTFSNTATENGDLKVDYKYQFAKDPKGITSFIFKLLVYNDKPATFFGDLRIKYKIDDEIEDSNIYETTSAGSLYTCKSSGLMAPSPLSNSLAKALVEGKEVKIIIENGKSKYNFTLDPDGFAELYQPAMYEYIKYLVETDEFDNYTKKDYRDYEAYSEAMESVGDYEDAKELAESYMKTSKKLEKK